MVRRIVPIACLVLLPLAAAECGGKVLGKDGVIPGATVMLVPFQAGGQAIPVHVDGSGNWRCPAIGAPGEYMVRAAAPGYAESQIYYVLTLHADGRLTEKLDAPLQSLIFKLALPVRSGPPFIPKQLPRLTATADSIPEPAPKKGGFRLPRRLPRSRSEALAMGASIAASRALNDLLPLKLDASSVLAPVTLPGKAFQPQRIPGISARDLDLPLPPGDYEIPVTMYCTRDSLHAAGQGVGYALAYMEGQAADALAMLYLRGALRQTPWSTLQTISWAVQASIPLSQMPAEHQALVGRLIPEYQNKLQGDFLSRYENTYNTLARQFTGGRLPAFDQVLANSGTFGQKIAEIKRSREKIRANALEFQRLEQELVNTTISKSEGSPWAVVRRGVTAQLQVDEGYHGRNWMKVRLAEPASVREILYGGGTTPKALISYPVSQPTQTHAIAPILDPSDCLEAAHPTVEQSPHVLCSVKDETAVPRELKASSPNPSMQLEWVAIGPLRVTERNGVPAVVADGKDVLGEGWLYVRDRRNPSCRSELARVVIVNHDTFDDGWKAGGEKTFCATACLGLDVGLCRACVITGYGNLLRSDDGHFTSSVIAAEGNLKGKSTVCGVFPLWEGQVMDAIVHTATSCKMFKDLDVAPYALQIQKAHEMNSFGLRNARDSSCESHAMDLSNNRLGEILSKSAKSLEDCDRLAYKAFLEDRLFINNPPAAGVGICK